MNDMNDHGIATASDTLRIARVLPGPIERVWAYLTESGKRERWFASGNMELREGGKVELVFDHDKISDEPYPEAYKKYKGSQLNGRVLRCEPPHVLAYTWSHSATSESEVTFELTPQGKDVLLAITHRKIGDRKAMVGFASGWDTHVGVLSAVLKGEKPQHFWSRLASLEKEYAQQLGS
jgi:uncharacterized protein YndB with AHSA1/START domain